ncbi:glycoside hydrolase family 3 C-terminal domain-containing protein [Paenibacillus sp. sptzw28]|nr:glycoside hydrolase family 3 C-terminal domain-containing protein [Paenibacillus sp. sptzw28]
MSYPFENVNLPLEERVNDLVSRFTLEEKIELMMQYQPAVDRLGVKPYKHGTEAAHGMAWLGEATSFPQPIGLGCTWNTELMRQIGSAIGDEARVFYQRNPAVNGLTLWAPTVDMERDPRWGRTEEAYGEDPHLTGELTASLVRGVQGDHPFYFKAVSTLKHFLGNNNEIDRGSCSASIDPRNMKEYYEAAFKPAFVQGGARSMMTAYNSINGTPAILHEDVNKVVKQEWGMDGFVVSDAGDLVGLVDYHHYYETYKEAAAHAVKAGIDSITDDHAISTKALREALAEGLLSESDLDLALQNTFRVRFRLGEFDPASLNPYADMPESVLCSPEHAKLSLEAARESIVLLKNDNGTLPLQKDKLGSVAVIGPLGDVVYRDWYSGSLPYRVTPFEAIRGKLPENAEITFKSGSDRLRLKSAASGKYVRVTEAEGRLAADAAEAAEGEIFEQTDWGWESKTFTSVTNGKYMTSTGDVHISASAEEAFGWYVKEVFHTAPAEDGQISLTTWNHMPVKISEPATGLLGIGENKSENTGERFIAEAVSDGLEEAVNAARAADTAIVFVGNNPLINGKEEIDRPDLTLAEAQERLIREVHKVNPNTIVVVVGSYPFALNEVNERIPAVLYMSHVGQELGRAVADVLFGDYSPAGRLNMTWYKSALQLTDIMDYDIIKSKRTYQYFDGEPLYPFGHGLTYPAFRYDGLEVTPSAVDENGTAIIRVQVTNTGSVASDEVIQLYVHVKDSRVKRPLKQLKGFRRIHFQPGEKQIVEFALPSAELAIWDVTRDRFCVESGSYDIMIGRSSGDIALSGVLTVSGETIPPRDLTLETRAENYDDYENVYLDESKEGGTCIRPSVPAGAWIGFTDAEWSRGSYSFEGRLSGGPDGGRIEVRFGSPDANPAGFAELGSVRQGQDWQTVSFEIGEAPGTKQDVYLVLSGDIILSRFRFTAKQ